MLRKPAIPVQPLPRFPSNPRSPSATPVGASIPFKNLARRPSRRPALLRSPPNIPIGIFFAAGQSPSICLPDLVSDIARGLLASAHCFFGEFSLHASVFFPRFPGSASRPMANGATCACFLCLRPQCPQAITSIQLAEAGRGNKSLGGRNCLCIAQEIKSRACARPDARR